jgi:prophage antirepressor-like protein
MEIVRAFENNELSMHITIKGTREEPLFRASDIGAILEIKNIHQNLATFNDTEKVISEAYTLGGKQEVTFLTEKGL